MDATSTLPPGPSRHPVLQGIRLLRQPAAYLEDCALRWGDCFTIRVPGNPPIVLFSDPAAVREIFTGAGDDLRAGEANGVLRPLLGSNSILLLDGPRHERERRMMLPPFHGERMLAYGDAMRDIAARAVDGWPRGRPFPVHSEMQGITLAVILRAVFGLEEGGRHTVLREALRRWTTAGTHPVLLWRPAQVDLGRLSPWGRFCRLRRQVDALLLAEIERRRAGESAGEDILSLLLAARDEQGEPLTNGELRDELMTLLAAGHETTATALAWTFHRLLAHPGVLARLRAELADVVGAGPLETERVARLEYLDATVRETLRLNPVIPDVGRLLVRPMRLGGWDLPAGVIVGPCIYLTHRRPDAWEAPEEFRPERFLGARQSPYAFFPFGGGTRRCIGMAFALYEMKVVLAEVLSRVELCAAPGYRPRTIRRGITLAPSEGMPLVVRAPSARGRVPDARLAHA